MTRFKTAIYIIQCAIYNFFNDLIFKRPPTVQTITRKMRSKRVFIFVMLLVPMLNFAVFFVYVNINSILMAFQNTIGTETFWTFAQFEKMFREFARPDSNVRGAIFNTLAFFPVNVFLSLPLSILFSFILFKKVWGYKFFRVVFFLPSIISAVVLTGLFKYIIAPNGPLTQLISTLLNKPIDQIPVWLADKNYAMGTIIFYCFWTSFGFNIVLLTGAMFRIPSSIFESASIDGVGFFGEMIKMVVPLMWPTVSTIIILNSASLFTVMGPIMLFTGGAYNTYTISYFIFSQVKNSGVYEYPSAIGLFFTVIGLPIIFTIRYVIGKIGQDIEY